MAFILKNFEVYQESPVTVLSQDEVIQTIRIKRSFTV